MQQIRMRVACVVMRLPYRDPPRPSSISTSQVTVRRLRAMSGQPSTASSRCAGFERPKPPDV
ncbi:MAG: hypothetical protein CMP09_15345 [Yangia sp.]|nr:hypothetical protein [Salipiger sp.]